MTTLMQADIFFFISSIGFIFLFVLLAVIFWRVSKLVKSLNRALDVLSEKIEDIGEETQELVKDVRDNTLFRLLLGSRRKKGKRESKK